MKPIDNSIIIKAKKVLCASPDAEFSGGLKIINGVIQALSVNEVILDNAEIIDFSDFTIAPLFCDYHLHFSEKSCSLARNIDQQLLSHGIGTVYEGGDKGAFGLTLRDRLNCVPALRTSGYALHKTGGYGNVIGRGVGNPSEAFAAIDELTALNIDYLKLINSGLYEPDSDRISAGGFQPEELREIVAYTLDKGLDVYCHANGDRAVREAVDAGVTAIIHGLGISNEMLAAMAEKRISFIPTVFAFKSLAKIAATETGRNNCERQAEQHLSKVKKARDLGVSVLPGSDSGPAFLPYGSSFIEELRMFDRAGIPLEDVIRSAANSTLQAGSPANFIVLDGLNVKAVMIDGRFIKGEG